MKISSFLVPAACALLSACSLFRTGSPSEPAVQPAVAPASPPAVQGEAPDKVWATFKNMSRTSEGGSIGAFAFSEKQGDATVSPTALRGDVLAVSGQFFGKGASQWAGVAVNIGAPKSIPVKAGEYKFLTIRLGSTTSSRLRVRLVGPDEAIQRMGCYPMVMQMVKPDVAEYRIPLDRFAPESYCGAKGVAAKPTLESLTAIEVTEVAGPVRDHAASFGVGTIALTR
ncbi:hypothetical protein [Piscinibacter terrae]|uniref:hypothetical protein n=1 Tax=Piscinibacter terrae TaxID=2496871 RepID=UPI000F5B57DF|nr:hypothetical protein [Albitalea terrae]